MSDIKKEVTIQEQEVLGSPLPKSEEGSQYQDELYSQGSSSVSGNRLSELTVLDTRPIYPPQSLTFGGYENENFIKFRSEFRQYMLLAGIFGNTARQIQVLHAVLRGPALAFFERKIFPRLENRHDGAIRTLNDVMELLELEYVTDHDILRMKEEFSRMTQRADESPRQFLGRLREAMDMVSMDDPDALYGRFKQGLIPEIRAHCYSTGILEHTQFLQAADGYWFAHREILKRKNLAPRYHKDAHKLLATQLVELNSWHEDRIANGDISDEEIDVLLQQGFKMTDAIKYLATRMAERNLSGMYFQQWPESDTRAPRQQNRYQPRQNRYNNSNRQNYSGNQNYQGYRQYNDENQNNRGSRQNYGERFNNQNNNGYGNPKQFPLPRKAPSDAPFYHSRRHEFGRNKSVPLDKRFTSINEETGAVEFDYEKSWKEDSDRRLEMRRQRSPQWNPPVQDFENDYRGQLIDRTQQPKN